MAETEEEERDAKRKVNNVTMDNFFNQSHVTNKTQGDIADVKSVHFTILPFHDFTISPSQGEIANVTSVHSIISPSQGVIASVTSERRISSDNLEETINGFNEFTIQ